MHVLKQCMKDFPVLFCVRNPLNCALIFFEQNAEIMHGLAIGKAAKLKKKQTQENPWVLYRTVSCNHDKFSMGDEL